MTLGLFETLVVFGAVMLVLSATKRNARDAGRLDRLRDRVQTAAHNAGQVDLGEVNRTMETNIRNWQNRHPKAKWWIVAAAVLFGCSFIADGDAFAALFTLSLILAAVAYLMRRGRRAGARDPRDASGHGPKVGIPWLVFAIGGALTMVDASSGFREDTLPLGLLGMAVGGWLVHRAYRTSVPPLRDVQPTPPPLPPEPMPTVRPAAAPQSVYFEDVPEEEGPMQTFGRFALVTVLCLAGGALLLTVGSARQAETVHVAAARQAVRLAEDEAYAAVSPLAAMERMPAMATVTGGAAVAATGTDDGATVAVSAPATPAAPAAPAVPAVVRHEDGTLVAHGGPAYSRKDALAQAYGHIADELVIALVGENFDTDAVAAWQPDPRWIEKEIAGARDTAYRPGPDGRTVYTATVPVDLPDRMKLVRQRFMQSQAGQRGLGLAQVYLGGVLMLGGLATFLRLGTGRKVQG